MRTVVCEQCGHENYKKSSAIWFFIGIALFAGLIYIVLCATLGVAETNEAYYAWWGVFISTFSDALNAL